MNVNPIITLRQMSLCEQRSPQYGVSLGELMNTAGTKLGRQVMKCLKGRQTQNVTILVGKGNNGGDGLVAAKYLYLQSLNPTVILCCGEPSTDLAKAALKKIENTVTVLNYSPKLDGLITDADIVIDCIFGTGFKGEIRENMYPLFEAVENSSAYVISCDIPSGANGENGQVSEHTVSADMTVTFHNKKLGMCLSPARYHCGEISVEDIGIPQRAVVGEDDDEPKEIITQLHDEEVLSGMLPPRIPWGHKGTFGKLVSVCGSESYIGAAGISTLAALRTGVGLVNLCAPKAVINSLSSRILECTYSAMKTDSDGFMTSENVPNILSKLESADCLLIGCGLGHTPETERLVATLVENSPCQIILDADGINSLCPNIDVLSKRKSTVTLTPHPAELARLCGVSTAEILSDRHRYATEFARKYNVTVVSKGAETILTDGDYTNIIAVGNTALAKGGSGDMLAGIIASFSAQNPIRGDSNALLGCYVMGNTAEMLSEERSQRGILATDIIDALPKYLRQLERPFRLP